MTNKPNLADCICDHKLQGTGAVFLYSIGWIICNQCKGTQKIRKSIEGNESMKTKRVKIQLESGDIINGVWHEMNGKEWLSDLKANVITGVVL